MLNRFLIQLFTSAITGKYSLLSDREEVFNSVVPEPIIKMDLCAIRKASKAPSLFIANLLLYEARVGHDVHLIAEHMKLDKNALVVP